MVSTAFQIYCNAGLGITNWNNDGLRIRNIRHSFGPALQACR